MSSDELYDKLQALIGLEGPREQGPDAVCPQMIRQWCEAMEDANPLYTDEAYAKKSKYGTIIAPPPSVQAFAMARLWPDGQNERWRPTRPKQGAQLKDPVEVIAEICIKYGYTGVMATNSSMEFIRPLVPGDRVTVYKKFIKVTTQKVTRAGSGYFVTLLRPYTNQKREVICNQTSSSFRFKPRSQ